jgi:Protein of unknown function (DUF2939)
MRRVFGVGMASAVAAALLFVALPMYAALDIGRAVRMGDLATLENRVDWPRVRESLKTSMADIERDQLTAAARRVRPSLWSRIKMAAAPLRYADQMVDRFVTPAGIVQMMQSRGTLRRIIAQPAHASASRGDDHVQPTPAMTASAIGDGRLSWHSRVRMAWSRVVRVSLRDLSTLEVEVLDQRGQGRRIVGVMERDGVTWRLVGVRVLAGPATG